MQISSIQSNPYITMNTSKVSNANQPKETNYQMMSLEDLEKLSYDEFKNNINTIQNRFDTILKESPDELNSNKDFLVNVSVMADRISIVNKFPNENMSKALFDTLNNTEQSSQKVFFASEIQQNLTDYYYGKNVQASFMVGEGIHSTESLTKQQMNSINFDDFISKMLSNFGKDVATSGGSVKQQYQGIVDGYSLLKQNYDFQKSEPIYA